MDERSPHRRVSRPVVLIRTLVRAVRLMRIRVLNPGKTCFAAGTAIGPGSRVIVPESMLIERYVSIGAEFLSQTNVHIGEHCLLSSRVSFIGHDHDLRTGQSAYLSGRLPPSTVVLEGDNFIGFGATLCGNICIGQGAIVGAGALVLDTVPPEAIVGGVPARIIGQRQRD